MSTIENLENMDAPIKSIHDPASKKELIDRISRIEGQLKGIKNLLGKDAYVYDILVQAAATVAAMNAFNRSILDSHLKTAVAEDFAAGSMEKATEFMAMTKMIMK